MRTLIRQILNASRAEQGISAFGLSVRMSPVLASCACLLGSAGAAAAPADNRNSDVSQQSEVLGEVIVTAQRREESIKEVPMSITALSGDRLSREGISNALELSYSVPGMSVSETGPGMQLIQIRGISSLRGVAPLIGTYLDDIPLSSFQSFFASSPDIRIVDLDRVEVLKGPQGTLFGEGAAGGVVRYITKDPQLNEATVDLSTRFSNTEGGDGSEEVTGIFNMPVVENVFGIRLAAQYSNQGGWIDQPSVGKKNINDSEVKHARFKALYAPTDKLRFDVTAQIHRNEGGGTNIVNRLSLSKSIFVQPVDRATLRKTSTDFYDDYDLFNLAVSYDLGFAELLSSTSHGSLDGNTGFPQVTAESTPYFELGSRFSRKTKVTTQEVRLTSQAQGPLSWTVGTIYKDAEIKSVTVGTDLLLFGGTPTQLALTDLDAGNVGVGSTENWAAFVDVSYQFADRFTVGGGLRYFNDTRDAYSVSGLTGVRDNSRTLHFDKVTYRLYGKYAVSDDTNVYASVGTGFRSGAPIGPLAVARGAPSSFAPDETVFYELGMKTAALDGRLRVDAALFYGKYENMQEDIGIISAAALLQYTANGQDAEIYGAEVSVDWLVAEQLTLGLSGDVTHTEITRIDPSFVYKPYNVGDPINYVPKNSISARADYSFSWTSSIPGFFQLAFSRKGNSVESQRHRYGNITLTDQATAPATKFLNASIGGESNGWRVSLFGDNLLNEDGATMPSITGITAQHRPRTFGVALGKNF